VLQQWKRIGLAGLLLGFSAATSASFELVSRIEDGPTLLSGPNAPSGSRVRLSPSVSADGRLVAFASAASNLAAEDTNGHTIDIFVYDRDADTTELLTPGGNSNSSWPSISADGRFVAFVSAASNLVSGDTNRFDDVFVYDRVASTFERITAGDDLYRLTLGDRDDLLPQPPSISADGRFVVFESSARGLFIYDRQTGEMEERDDLGLTTRTFPPAVSADGRFIAFSGEYFTDRFPPVDDILVYDRENEVIEVVTSGGPGNSSRPTISADGRFVTFESFAGNLVIDDPNGGAQDVFLHDREHDSTELISTGGNQRSGLPTISADGRVVVFYSQASNLVAGDTNGEADIFVYSRETDSLELLTQGADGSSLFTATSADGGVIAVYTASRNLVAGNNSFDLLVFDQAQDSVEGIPNTGLSFERAGGNDSSGAASVSANGQLVAFVSSATDLAPGNIDGDVANIFVYDRNAERNELITEGANDSSRFPTLSADGRFVAFQSSASNLVAGDTNGLDDVFVYDRATDTMELLTSLQETDSGATGPAISADGRFVVFYSSSNNLRDGSDFGIVGYDRETDTAELLVLYGGFDLSISADGRFIAFETGVDLVPEDTDRDDDVYVYDRNTDELELVSGEEARRNDRPVISADGRFVAYEAGSIIMVYDRVTKVRERVSFGNGAFGHSPSISADGRFVAFWAAALDPFRGAGRYQDDVFVFDRDTNTTRLLTPGGNGESRLPSISGSGKEVAFTSRTLGLANDSNGMNTDVFLFVSNNPPTANAKATVTSEDVPLSLTLTGFDPEFEDLTFEVLTQPANGELTGIAPELVYTPNVNFSGVDSFAFSASDGNESSLPATVSIEVSSVNDAPIAGAASGSGTDFTTPEDTAVVVTLEGNDVDGDALTFAISTLPANGSLSGALPNLTYTPDVNFSGSDSFTYTVSDGQATSVPATVEIMVDGTVSLLSAVLPASRSIDVGSTATAFATLINAGSTSAAGCSLQLPETLAAEFSYQISDPTTNELVGDANQPVDIAAGTSQSFVIGITPREELLPMEVALRFQCTNANDAASVVGLNTLLLSASAVPAPDLIALAATTTTNGVMELDNNIGFFTAATINVGSAGTISVSADTGAATMPITFSLCQTDPLSSVCINPAVPGADPVIVDIGEGESPTFAVFATATEAIALDPANSRVFLRFRDDTGVVRGATSVAVESTL